MTPQLIIVNDDKGVEDLFQYLADKELVAFDTETTGITSRDEIIGFSVCAEEDKAYYVITKIWDNNSQKLISSNISNYMNIIAILSEKQLIMHNGVFDCKMVESNYKIRLIDNLHTDTMILAHILNENRRVGLKELCSTIFGEDSIKEQEEMKTSITANGGVITKGGYELYKADPYLIGKYGAKDALLTLKLFYHLAPDLVDQNLEDFFYRDESMPMLRTVTYELNTTGLQVDQLALQTLKKNLEAESAEAHAFIHQEIASRIKEQYPGTNKKNTFNIGSNNQLAWLLFGIYNLEFGTLTKTGKEVCKYLNLRLPYTPSAKRDFIAICCNNEGKVFKVKSKIRAPWNYIAADKASLSKLAPKLKWVQKLLEYKTKQKILNTYVEGIESRIQYGVIYPSFLQHGTTSGRYSSRDPNFQNLPRDDKRIKSCIQARDGKVFVGADYSQLEPRVFAFFSKDARLLDAFKSADDFYSVIGMEVYDKYDCTPRKDGSPDAFGIKYKKLRDLSKVIALASTYGATAHQLAPTTGKSIKDTAQDIESYFEKFPGVRQMMLDSHESAKKNGYVINYFGRPRRMPEAKLITKLYGKKEHADLPYEARNLLNLSVNHRVQSTGASIVNRAAIQYIRNTKEAGIKSKIVLQVHDSLIIECNEADANDVSLLLQDAMENTVQLEGIVLEAIPKIGKTLAEV